MLLEKYSNICSAAGDEDRVRECIRKDIEGFVEEISVNPIGNLTAVMKGKKRGQSLLITAHMDEVAFIVKSVEKNGLIKFHPLGGFVTNILPGNSIIIGKDRIPGVIACKSYHLVPDEERRKTPVEKELYIDVGASESDDVKNINPGDYVYFRSKFFRQNGNYFGKAFDDRVGCSAITEILKVYKKDPPPITINAVYTAQEEVGLRGGATAAFGYKDLLFNLNLEGTTSSDRDIKVTYSPGTELGKGPAITFMDRTSITQRKLLDFVISIARQYAIPFQLKKGITGGTDAGVIHLTERGIPSITVSVPVRYIHSPWNVIMNTDYRSYINLVKAVVNEASRFTSQDSSPAQILRK